MLALVAILIVGGLASSNFLTAGNLSSILVACSILIVVAIGQTFVIITAGIDLSVGSLVQVSSVFIGVAVSHKLGVPAGIVFAVAAGTLFGVLNGLIVSKGKISDFIVTLGILSIVSGVALVLSNGRPVVVISPFLTALASGRIGPIPNIALLAAAIAIVSHRIWPRSACPERGTHSCLRQVGCKQVSDQGDRLMAASHDDKMEAEFEALALAISAERRRELAVEHLLFQTVAYVERQNPGLLDHLEESVAHLGDSANDDTKDDEAVREIARLFIRSLRKKTD